MDEEVDASRRTYLANERTYLAWWRTGLASLTVALAAARVVPELSGTTVRWPYTVVGVGFALIGLTQIIYAERRREEVESALARGEFIRPHGTLTLAITCVSVVLGLMTLGLILFG